MNIINIFFRGAKDQLVEEQLDSLTLMLQEALTKAESLDSLPIRNDSESSSQGSFVDHGPPEGNGDHHYIGKVGAYYRSRMRSDSGAESMSDTPPTPPEGTPTFYTCIFSLLTSLSTS